MLKTNSIIARLKPPSSVSFMLLAGGLNNTNRFARYYCTYTRLTHTKNTPYLHTQGLLFARAPPIPLSPLLYPSVRYFATNHEQDKPNDKLKDKGETGIVKAKETDIKEKDKDTNYILTKDRTGITTFGDTVKRWESKGKKVLKHYWLGTKLLYTNISITFKLVKSLIKGHTLSRRERKLLVQTSADIFRLIPFIIIVVVPFLELALPILLRFFPNLLPSTYEWKDKKEADRAKRLRANVEMAKFLQEAMGELAHDLKQSNAVNADEFLVFMTKVKRGEKVTNKEILTFSRLFEDELTLDKISREQLFAMHNYFHGSTFQPVKWLSTDYLRTRISSKIEKIKQDDALIQKEGLDAMTLDELVDASLVRGMKVVGLNRAAITKQLRSWLDLSLNHNVPPALLILSRAFMMKTTEPAAEALEDTLAHIPQEALEEVVRELPADQVERTQERLEELAKEKAMIDKQTKVEAEAKAKAKAQAKAQKMQEESIKPKEAPVVLDTEAEIKEIKKLDTDVETLKQQSGKILEEIDHAKGEPEAKSSKVLAKKLAGMLQGIEQGPEPESQDKTKEAKPKEETKAR